MPCGPALIEAVASQLEADSGYFPDDLKMFVMLSTGKHSSLRAIRYAISELIKSGRAKRKGRQGPVYAVRVEI